MTTAFLSQVKKRAFLRLWGIRQRGNGAISRQNKNLSLKDQKSTLPV